MRLTGKALRQPDSTGRIVIGRQYIGKHFAIEELPDGNILLQPVVIRHEREQWLYDNPEAMEALDRALLQSANGEGVFIGSFAEYADGTATEE